MWKGGVRRKLRSGLSNRLVIFWWCPIKVNEFFQKNSSNLSIEKPKISTRKGYLYKCSEKNGNRKNTHEWKSEFYRHSENLSHKMGCLRPMFICLQSVNFYKTWNLGKKVRRRKYAESVTWKSEKGKIISWWVLQEKPTEKRRTKRRSRKTT